jgi:hypothetical protein
MMLGGSLGGIFGCTEAAGMMLGGSLGGIFRCTEAGMPRARERCSRR